MIGPSTAFLALALTLPPPARAGDDLLYSREITVVEEHSEYRMRLQASAPGTSWEEKGKECAVLRVVVDGDYDQHVFIFGENSIETYEFIVGPLSSGIRLIEIYWERTWTSEVVERPSVLSLSAVLVDRSDPSQEPLLRAPILHLRKDTVGRFTDVPLLMYWESQDQPSRKPATVYTVIFSNEDGGTNSERLMARWGRTTDIEWCYSYARSGNGLVEEYQGPDHKVLSFGGTKLGSHPILYNVTLNNNFADALADPSPYRVRHLPHFVDLRDRAREWVMDQFPWTYAVMARELSRELKLEMPADAESARISDPRNYAYFEICADQRGTELYFEVAIEGNRRWLRSDHGDPKASVARSGCFRSTVELPSGTRAEQLRALRIQCRPVPVREGERPPPTPAAMIRQVSRLFLLQEDYSPGRNLLQREVRRVVRPGRALTIYLPQ